MPSRITPYYYKEPAWVQEQIDADRNKKLSSKDRADSDAMKASVNLSMESRKKDIETEMSPYNIASLEEAIAGEGDPEVLKILRSEQVNVNKLLAARDQIIKDRKAAEVPSFIDHMSDLLKNLWKVQ